MQGHQSYTTHLVVLKANAGKFGDDSLENDDVTLKYHYMTLTLKPRSPKFTLKFIVPRGTITSNFVLTPSKLTK